MLPLLCLSHCILLQHLMQPNLTLAICQSFHFQSLFSYHWLPKRVFPKINPRGSGMMHVLPWETKYAQIKKGDCNRLFLSSFFILFWAAVSILLLFHWIILPATISFMASSIKQAILWLFFVVNLLLTTRPGQAFWSILLTVICIVFIVPTIFYTIYTSIYDFGPKHCKQSFIDILTQPIPGIKFEEQHERSDSHRHCRFNHEMVSCRLL